MPGAQRSRRRIGDGACFEFDADVAQYGSYLETARVLPSFGLGLLIRRVLDRATHTAGAITRLTSVRPIREDALPLQRIDAHPGHNPSPSLRASLVYQGSNNKSTWPESSKSRVSNGVTKKGSVRA